MTITHDQGDSLDVASAPQVETNSMILETGYRFIPRPDEDGYFVFTCGHVDLEEFREEVGQSLAGRYLNQCFVGHVWLMKEQPPVFMPVWYGIYDSPQDGAFEATVILL